LNYHEELALLPVLSVTGEKKDKSTGGQAGVYLQGS